MSSCFPHSRCWPDLSHFVCDPGFMTGSWVFFQLLQCVNTVMANVDKRTQVGSGRPRSALAGVARSEPGTALGGVPCCLRWGLRPFSFAFLLLWGRTAVCTEASSPPWRGMPRALRSRWLVSSGGWAWWSLSAVLEPNRQRGGSAGSPRT